MYRFAWVKDQKGNINPVKYEVREMSSKFPIEVELIVYSITKEEYLLPLSEIALKHPYKIIGERGAFD